MSNKDNKICEFLSSTREIYLLDLNPTLEKLLSLIAFKESPGNPFYYSNSAIARELNVSKDTAMRAVLELETLGHITIDRPSSGATNTLYYKTKAIAKSNRYRLQKAIGSKKSDSKLQSYKELKKNIKEPPLSLNGNGRKKRGLGIYKIWVKKITIDLPAGAKSPDKILSDFGLNQVQKKMVAADDPSYKNLIAAQTYEQTNNSQAYDKAARYIARLGKIKKEKSPDTKSFVSIINKHKNGSK